MEHILDRLMKNMIRTFCFHTIKAHCICDEDFESVIVYKCSNCGKVIKKRS